MVIDQLSKEWWLPVLTANYATGSYPSKIPTVTRPSGSGVIDMTGGDYVPGHLLLIPYGTDAGTHTAGMKVLGWRDTNQNPGNPQMRLWVPVVLCTVAITLGSAAGVANADLGTTQKFATTMTMTGGPTFITSGAAPVCLDWFEISPGSNAIGLVSVPTFGFKMMEVIFTTGSDVTDINALYTHF